VPVGNITRFTLKKVDALGDLSGDLTDLQRIHPCSSQLDAKWHTADLIENVRERDQIIA